MYIYDGREQFSQWDIDVMITSTDFKVGDEVHITNSRLPNAMTVLVHEYKGKAVIDVPNILLQTTYPIIVFRYIKDDKSGYTIDKQEFVVNQRQKPDDYVYTETEVKSWENLAEDVQNAMNELSDNLNELNGEITDIDKRVEGNTKALENLDQVDNTSDADKPISNAQGVVNTVFQNKLNQVYGMADYAALNVNRVADYIVEEGATDTYPFFTWRKWNSGIAEVWFTGMANGPMDEMKTQSIIDLFNVKVYYKKFGNMKLPFRFISRPKVTTWMTTNASGIIIPTATAPMGEEQNVPSVMYLGAEPYNQSTMFQVDYYVVGRYRTTPVYSDEYGIFTLDRETFSVRKGTTWEQWFGGMGISVKSFSCDSYYDEVYTGNPYLFFNGRVIIGVHGNDEIGIGAEYTSNEGFAVVDCDYPHDVPKPIVWFSEGQTWRDVGISTDFSGSSNYAYLYQIFDERGIEVNDNDLIRCEIYEARLIRKY